MYESYALSLCSACSALLPAYLSLRESYSDAFRLVTAYLRLAEQLFLLLLLLLIYLAFKYASFCVLYAL